MLRCVVHLSIAPQYLVDAMFFKKLYHAGINRRGVDQGESILLDNFLAFAYCLEQPCRLRLLFRVILLDE